MESPNNLNQFHSDKNMGSKTFSQMENFNLAHLLLNHESVVLNLNAECLTLLGIDTKEIIGKEFTEFIHPEDKLRFREVFQNAHNSSEQMLIELRIKKNDNDYFHALLLINNKPSDKS